MRVLALATEHRAPTIEKEATRGQRRQLRKLLSEHLSRVAFLLEIEGSAARCVDPESALHSVETMARCCRDTLARASRILSR